MSTAMNFGSKTFKPRPPDKGAFPLDHFGAVPPPRPPRGLAPGLPRASPPLSSGRAGGTRAWGRRPSSAVARPSLSLSGECSAFKERFMECLRDSGYESGACRQRAMAYLECRMERQVVPALPGSLGAARRGGLRGGPRGGGAAGFPLRGGEGNPQWRRSRRRLVSLQETGSFAASAVPLAFGFTGSPARRVG